MRHLKKIVPTAIVAAAMLVAVNFMGNSPRAFADGSTCATWATEYHTQLVQGAPRWVPWTDYFGRIHWRLVPTSYYTTVPVQVCTSYVTVVTVAPAPTTQTVIYAPQPIYPYAYAYTPWGYLPTAAYYGKYIPNANTYYPQTPQ